MAEACFFLCSVFVAVRVLLGPFFLPLDLCQHGSKKMRNHLVKDRLQVLGHGAIHCKFLTPQHSTCKEDLSIPPLSAFSKACKCRKYGRGVGGADVCMSIQGSLPHF